MEALVQLAAEVAGNPEADLRLHTQRASATLAATAESLVQGGPGPPLMVAMAVGPDMGAGAAAPGAAAGRKATAAMEAVTAALAGLSVVGQQ